MLVLFFFQRIVVWPGSLFPSINPWTAVAPKPSMAAVFGVKNFGRPPASRQYMGRRQKPVLGGKRMWPRVGFLHTSKPGGKCFAGRVVVVSLVVSSWSPGGLLVVS